MYLKYAIGKWEAEKKDHKNPFAPSMNPLCLKNKLQKTTNGFAIV